MPRRRFKFGRNINRYDLPHHEVHGPRFHCWLPNGEADAIDLTTDDPTARVRVWFNRYGRMASGFIKFQYDEHDVDPVVIPTQGMLEAGPLLGDLDMDLSDDEVRILTVGGNSAGPIAKKIFGLIRTPVGRFIRLLRTHYGQYWLEDWPAFDSRTETVQNAIQGLSLRWQPQGDDDWKKLEIGEAVVMLVGTVPQRGHFAKFLTEDDWQELRRLANEHDPTQTSVQIGLAHEAIDRGDLKTALIDATTACELAINECMTVKDKAVKASFEAFWGLPLKAQLSTVNLTRCPDAMNLLPEA